MNEQPRDFFQPVDPAKLNDELRAFGFAPVGRDLIKVDLDTPLEQFVKAGAYSLLILNVLFSKLNIGLLRGFGWLLTGFFMILMKSVDNFYLIHLQEKAIFYQFCCFISAAPRKVAHFSEIALVTASATPMGFPVVDVLRQWSGQIGRRPEEITPTEMPPEGLWEYAVMVVLKNGRLLSMSDWQKEAFYVANRKAQLLAQAMNVPFLPCPRQGVAIVFGGFDGAPVSVFHRVDPS